MFIKEVIIDFNIRIRITIKYNGGLFEFRIIIINGEEWILFDRLDFLGNLIYPEYKESLGEKCLPISTNDWDTELILKKVISLIDEFILEFKNEILKAE